MRSRASNLLGRLREPGVLIPALALVGLVYAYVAWPGSTSGTGPSGQLAIADLRGHALLLLELDDPGAPTRVALPAAPHELVELDGGELVVSLPRAGALAVVRLPGGDVRVIEVGGIPHGLAVQRGSEGAVTLLVTDRSRDHVRRFDTATWTELEPLPTGATPHAVATGADGTIAVANADDSTLQIGDRVIAVSAYPETVAASRGRIAVAGAHGGAVEVFDTAGRPLARHELGARPVRVAFSPDGATLAVALSAGGEVAILDDAGGVRRVAIGGMPDGLAFTADGRRLLAGDLAGGTLAIIDVERAEVTGWLDAESSGGALLVRSAGSAPTSPGVRE